jgi:hypothetical protein
MYDEQLDALEPGVERTTDEPRGSASTFGHAT